MRRERIPLSILDDRPAELDWDKLEGHYLSCVYRFLNQCKARGFKPTDYKKLMISDADFTGTPAQRIVFGDGEVEER